MSDTKFDHTGIAETSRHFPSLQEKDIIPQIFWGHFMIQQLDSITECNKHDPFLGLFQYGVTYYLSTGNLMCRNVFRERTFWPWQMKLAEM